MTAISRADAWLARANRIMAASLADESDRGAVLSASLARSAIGCAGIATAYAATGGVFIGGQLGDGLSPVVEWN